MSASRSVGLLLVAPALLLVSALFVYPFVLSVASAVSDPAGGVGPANFIKAFDFYSGDILYTIFIVAISTVLVGLVSIAIAGYLTMGETPWLVSGLAWLYRWPLFIPFIVAAQCMRTFLAKNGMLNNTVVWKQVPFVAMLLAGAMASLDRSAIEAARNLGGSRLRCVVEIVLPLVAPTLMVGLILSFVTMLSVLSVPMMVAGSQPTMLSVDIAFRINAYGDYGVANALGVISYLMTAITAWLYLRYSLRQ